MVSQTQQPALARALTGAANNLADKLSSPSTAPPIAGTARQLPSTSSQTETLSLTRRSSKSKKSSNSALQWNSPSGVPRIQIDHRAIRQDSTTQNLEDEAGATNTASQTPSCFTGITIDIPSGGLGDELLSGNIEIPQKRDMLLDGEKPNYPQPANGVHVPEGRRTRSSPSLRARAAPKVLSVDEEVLSRKVRSFYEFGAEIPRDADGSSSLGRKMGLRWQDALKDHDGKSTGSMSRATSTSELRSNVSIASGRVGTIRELAMEREEHETAGGIEDWQDVQSEEVDRYGFIIPKISASEQVLSSDMKPSPSSAGPQPLQRVSTSLLLASEAPRRKHTAKRSPNSVREIPGSSAGSAASRPSSKHSIMRPTSSHSSHHGSFTGNSFRLRHATNKLPHNKSRRLVDEAGDMLTLPSELASVAENSVIENMPSHPRRKETEREEKWRKMAKVVSKGSHGSGMVFEFDTHSTKVIERTWKGIPDRWRATAWYSFLSSSAKKRKDGASDEELIAAFHDYLSQGSPDDMQIDIDVPRTVSGHVMFRRRYRGGQRLLFHVLHAMSLHFPQTGYVQGMAALAATLLAYYEEERAFVMMVRMWELRGLDKLYKPGFGGLMAGFDDFEKSWLGQGELAAKLKELNISPTTYGTRWYLTLFNYSIPFPAQLRVWDVFMLLGDDDSQTTTTRPGSGSTHLGTCLDVLHATSAALIDGMRDILLDSDFENAMKVLTSWVPIKDEDLFMLVARAEWKMHKRKGLV